MNCRISIAMLLVSFFVIGIAVAQPEVTKQPLITNASVLFWAKETQIDWFSGIALALTGFVGALVTVFFLIGGAIPGTAGQVNIDYDSEQLNEYKVKLKELWSKGQINPDDLAEAQELKSMVNDFGDRLNKERWRQFSLSALLYIVIGAFFAAFLAHDVLQALVIGAGWTGYLGAVGLKSDAQERGSRKNEKIVELLNALRDKDRDNDIILKERDKAIEEKDKILTELKKELEDIYASL